MSIPCLGPASFGQTLMMQDRLSSFRAPDCYDRRTP